MRSPSRLGKKRAADNIHDEFDRDAKVPRLESPSPTAKATVGSPSSQEFLLTAQRVPWRTLKEMKQAGAEVSRQDGIAMAIMQYPGPAMDVFESFVAELGDDDPVLSVLMQPPVGVPTDPNMNLRAVVAEASSILHYYHRLRQHDFRGGLVPALGPVLVNNAPGVRFHHASIAGHIVAQRIAAPNDARQYPAITAVPSGHYLCTIQEAWVGTQLFIHVLRM